jgi:superfamily II DNA or RNA helicase
MKLRPYQQKAVDQLNQFIEGPEKTVCLMLPTGAGKTFTLSAFLYQHLFERFNDRVLILVHREELLKQFAEAVTNVGIRCDTIKAGKHFLRRTNVFVGMVETVNRRKGILENADLIIIDECHIGNFKKIFDKTNAKIIGITATPTSSSTKDPLSNYYQRLIIGAEIDELVDAGYLCNSETLAWKTVDDNSLKIKQGEYETKGMSVAYQKTQHLLNVVDNYWKYAAGKKTIVFNVDIEHNMLVYRTFKAEGLNVKYIDSYSADKTQRADIFNWFKTNSDAILCNVGIATTGLDVPDIEVVILNRMTRSLPLYLQMVGRGSRPVEGKKDFFTILDFGGSSNDFGEWTLRRDWEFLFAKQGRGDGDGQGVGGGKACPKCMFINSPKATDCKNCQYVFPTKDPNLDPSGQLVRLGDSLFTADIQTVLDLHKGIIEKGEKNGRRDWNLVFAIANKIVKDYEFKSGGPFPHKDPITVSAAVKYAKPYFPAASRLMIDKLQLKGLKAGSLKWAIVHICEDAASKKAKQTGFKPKQTDLGF